ncbi:hypothetical protein QBC35DRAFT_535173 [Podospora australis]|uniref:Uncharacterized protein n=1 Tax=Podospora australis TaxID=1536484 RepID=A0AAN6WL93_9PEZI|nr:hypothetical protein QBC35DRAFT_535173 [Podospora australis]
MSRDGRWSSCCCGLNHQRQQQQSHEPNLPTVWRHSTSCTSSSPALRQQEHHGNWQQQEWQQKLPAAVYGAGQDCARVNLIHSPVPPWEFAPGTLSSRDTSPLSQGTRGVGVSEVRVPADTPMRAGDVVMYEVHDHQGDGKWTIQQRIPSNDEEAMEETVRDMGWMGKCSCGENTPIWVWVKGAGLREDKGGSGRVSPGPRIVEIE